MNIIDIINKKREGDVLTDEEIAYFVTAYTNGDIEDYQASALLMAICIRGMTERETATLTLCIRDSGDKIDLSAIKGIKVDKHSTGGVGDKTTLVVAPIVAACGVKVAKMSGRGLGHTGGTLDKLESIQGFSTTMGRTQFVNTVNTIGLSVIGQSGNLAPADKKLYALRDVTGTVKSIALIASSIMGKKLASGADRIVLDVKVGSGAFMERAEDAVQLAEAMVKIGKAAGKPTHAVISDMSSPLGYTVGNSLEVEEAINTLKGKGEAGFTELCTELAAQMLTAAEKGSIEDCRAMAKAVLDDGRALVAFRTMITAQGGKAACIDDPGALPQASVKHPVFAETDGYICKQDALSYGKAACVLGAGRVRKEDGVDHSAGVYLVKKLGDKVTKGEVVAYLHTNNPSSVATAEQYVKSGTEIGRETVAKKSLILGKINDEGELTWIN